MAIGKQIRRYRDKLGWRLKDLAVRSGVDTGTINALERRNSVRSEHFQAIASAFGLTVEQMADEATEHTPNPRPAPVKPKHVYGNGALLQAAGVNEPADAIALVPVQDVWTKEAINIFAQLDDGQKQAMVAKMREYRQYLGPPRGGQTLSMAA